MVMGGEAVEPLSPRWSTALGQGDMAFIKCS